MKEDILLVDDEQGLRKVMAISLADRGYGVHTAENGQQALDLFERLRPAIVITDIKMPGMDGIELLQHIKRIDADTEMIMLTGHGDIDLAIRSLKYAASDFITKPVDDDVLDIALQRAAERLTMKRQLRAYTENLERLVAEKTKQLIQAERMAAVGETVAGLAHAIKNIASGLKGGAFVVEQGLAQDDRTCLRQGWEMVSANVARIQQLSLDLLRYGKPADLSFTPCDPAGPLRDVAALIAPEAEKDGISVQLTIDAALKPVRMDAEAIHRCLLNLATNALEACRAAAAGDSPSMTLCAGPAAGWGVEYVVADTAAGIDAGVQDKMFQTFFSTKGEAGTGIGLMLTRKIVDQHGGVIDVDAAPGKGARFTICLPADGPADGAAAPP